MHSVNTHTPSASHVSANGTFDVFNLDPRLMRAVAEAGYVQATPIQASAIPVALAKHDLIGTAQTGTGKTAAFVLPILQKILTEDGGRKTEEGKSSRRSSHRALIVTPTRELAEQINDSIKALARHTKIRSATIYGGVGAGPQERALRDGVEILVACPGRLLDHIDARIAKLDTIDTLVLDEADRMFDMGFLPQIRRILQHVPKQRQTMLFSATFPQAVEELAASNLHQPKRVNVGLSQPAHTVAHALYPVSAHLKKKLLIALLRKTDAFAMLVFTRTKHRAEALARQLEREGFKTTSLHSDRSQGQRQKALDGFKSGKYQIMVATDIAARGLDVETVSHVINYDIPDTVDAYIHRIGRTGRAQREGDAFTLITPEDHEMVRDIERALKQKIARETLAEFDYNAAAPERSEHSGSGSFQRFDRNGSARPSQGRPERRQGREQGRDSGRDARREPRRDSNRDSSRQQERQPSAVASQSNEPSVTQINRLMDQTSGDTRRQSQRPTQRPLRRSTTNTGTGSGSGAGRRVYMTRDERKAFG